jgi:hypothetical protein
MGTKASPTPDDCYTKALPHEEVFTLAARDPAASTTLRFWAQYRIAIGKNKPGDADITEALECATRMDNQYHNIRKELGKP